MRNQLPGYEFTTKTPWNRHPGGGAET